MMDGHPKLPRAEWEIMRRLRDVPEGKGTLIERHERRDAVALSRRSLIWQITAPMHIAMLTDEGKAYIAKEWRLVSGK